MKKLKQGLLIGLMCLITFFIRTPALAQQTEMETNGEPGTPPKEETIEARVSRILEEKNIKIPPMDREQPYQKLELMGLNGSKEGKSFPVENGNLPVAKIQKYKVGDEIVLTVTEDMDGKELIYITDNVRRRPLYYLFAVFVMLTVLIARWQGLTSLIGMAVSFGVIFMIILPNIASGANPILTAIFGSCLIIPLTFYLSHGINKKTTIAIVGTVIALIVTGVLGMVMIEATSLSGLASEEAQFLEIAKGNSFPLKELLLAGIIIGALGVLDDITISQAAIVAELKKANKELYGIRLYRKAMNVGKDHIASVVNTLVLVYTGAALPLLLLFMDSSLTFSNVLNYEMVAEEIIRTLVASIGLILAVPLTTAIAVLTAN